MTLALDSNHDLHINSRSGIVLASGVDAVVQGILTRLRLFLAEWYLDTDAGTPWFQSILVDHPDIRQIEIDIRRQILSTPDVSELISFDFDFTPTTRTGVFTFSVDTIFGPTGLIEVPTP